MNNPDAERTADTDFDPSSDRWAIVIRWGQGQCPTPDELQQLKDWPVEKQVWQRLTGTPRAAAEDTAGDVPGEPLVRRAALLQNLCQRLERGAATLPLAGSWTDWTMPLWGLWLPLALHINDAQQRLNAPYVQGILGGQGTGKSTLASLLQLLLSCLGQQAVSLSLDDLYLTYRERQELAQQSPQWVWRGPPGTHDVALGIRTLSALSGSVDQIAGRSIAVPRFDKSLHQGQGDRRYPLIVSSPTVILFEGWFVGAEPLPENVINRDTFVFPAPIVSQSDRQFAIACNHRLRDYLPLWAFLHSLVVLQPQDYRLSLQWRQEAEYRMMEQGKPGLSPEQIADFVAYFWKALHPELFIRPLTLRNAARSKSNLVVNMCHNHQIGSLYLPQTLSK